MAYVPAHVIDIEVKDYAQISILTLFEIRTPGGLDFLRDKMTVAIERNLLVVHVATSGPGWSCLERQKDTLDSMHFVPDGKCDPC